MGKLSPTAVPQSSSTRSWTLSSVLRPSLLALTAFVLLTALHRRYALDVHDPYKCSALMNEGRWLDLPASRPVRHPPQTWQPLGCFLREYNSDDISHCSTRRILFAGDSTVRQLFWTTAKKLDKGDALKKQKLSNKYSNTNYTSRDVRLDFIPDPFLNSSDLFTELQAYSKSINDPQASKGNVPIMIVIGSGMSYARHFDSDAVRRFKSAVDDVLAYTQRLDGAAWQSTDPFTAGFEGLGDLVFFLPVEEPLYERLSPARQRSIEPQEIEQMNGYLHQLDPSQGVNIPWVWSVMSSKKWSYEQSGLHVIETIANLRADVLLNLRCNHKVDSSMGAPYERTCCSNYTSGNWLQWVIFIVSITALPIAALWSAGKHDFQLKVPIKALAVIGVALAYSFLADRSTLFQKDAKLYRPSDFKLLFLVPLVCGLLYLRPTGNSPLRKDADELLDIAQHAFLPVEILEEMKGVVALFMLVFNWTNATKELWAYEVSRLLIASYLFILGYRYALYFYERADYSFSRAAPVLIRLNVLTCLMTYLMYTRYLPYFYAALLTFWFLVVWITMRVASHLNSEPFWLFGKLIISAILCQLLHFWSEPTDLIFHILRTAFGISWDASAWRTWVSLDQYIVHVGMLVAFLQVWTRQALDAPQYFRGDRLRSFIWLYFPFLRTIFAILAAIALPVFWILTRASPDEADYNWWQPILAWVPILSFVVLRNSTSLLRSYYSPPLAWLGGCSLEALTLQNHLLMAADGKGILRIGLLQSTGRSLADRYVELALLAPIFFWMCSNVSWASNILAKWFVDGPVVERPSDSERPVGKRKLSRLKSGLPVTENETERVEVRNVKMRFGALVGLLWFLNLAAG
ncbi:Cas1p-domain-containing protein [Trichodelitschia bisporula]|uniref:Cas1p-domain-containing protein n=1 Tax=Trichodelitschia bisporula TaxID=703511 RepID=A0A6G1HKL4_9PEZI|nr:Cas1p-domain-containing protein [Trichodelitschia bisporula]